MKGFVADTEREKTFLGQPTTDFLPTVCSVVGTVAAWGLHQTPQYLPLSAVTRLAFCVVHINCKCCDHRSSLQELRPVSRLPGSLRNLRNFSWSGSQNIQVLGSEGSLLVTRKKLKQECLTKSSLYQTSNVLSGKMLVIFVVASRQGRSCKNLRMHWYFAFL